MRFQVMYKKSAQPKEAYLPFFESDDIAEIKDFAMRLAFIEGNDVYVQDTAFRPDRSRSGLFFYPPGHTKPGGDFLARREEGLSL